MSVLGWFPRAWTRSFTRPLCAMTYAYGSDCRKLWRLRSCSLSLVVDISFPVQRQNLMVQTIQQTTEIPQLLFDGRCLRYAGVQRLRCCRGEDLGAPTVAARTLSTTLRSDHRFSPVAVQGCRRPCLQVVQISMSWRSGLSHGPACLDHRDSPAAVLRHGDQCPCCAGLEVPGAVVVETVEFSQLPLLRKPYFPGGPGHGCRNARWRADMGQLIVALMS